jgi:hypothetical protein
MVAARICKDSRRHRSGDCSLCCIGCAGGRFTNKTGVLNSLCLEERPATDPKPPDICSNPSSTRMPPVSTSEPKSLQKQSGLLVLAGRLSRQPNQRWQSSSKPKPVRSRAEWPGALRLAAQARSKSKSALGEYCRRTKGRLGKAEGITATAYKLARILYAMITSRKPYNEKTAFALTPAKLERRLRHYSINMRIKELLSTLNDSHLHNG